MIKFKQPKFMTDGNTVNQLLVLFLLSIAVIALIAGVIGYKFGRYQGSNSAVLSISDSSGRALSITEIRSLKLENDILKSEMETLIQERDISLNNLNLLRDEMANLRTSNLQLEQLNETLFKAVALDGGIPLKVLAAQIAPLPENTYEYRFDVAMLAEDGQSKTLVPKLTLLNSTDMVTIPLTPSTYDLKGVANIRGRFVMPEGFTPKQIHLVLEVDGQKIDQRYNWRVGEVIANAPSSLADAPKIDHSPISQ